jgi:hypothetical protein
MKYSKLEREIKNQIGKIIDYLVKDPRFLYQVDSITTIYKKSKSGDREYPVTCIQVSTNNRPLLLGQFMYFPINGIRGFHNDWIEGYLKGYLEAKIGLGEDHEIHFEVFPMKHEKKFHYTYNYLTLNEAQKRNLITPGSPLARKMKKYHLDKVLVEGGIVAGPDLGLLRVVERFVRSHNVEHMIDLFSGTGSLAKVALANGAQSCTCIDIQTEACQANLKEFSGKVHIVNADAFLYKPEEKVYDLVVADPFIDFSFKVAKCLSKIYRRKAKVFMLTIGFIEDLYWQSLVSEELKKWFPKVRLLNHGRLIQAICQSDLNISNNSRNECKTVSRK